MESLPLIEAYKAPLEDVTNGFPFLGSFLQDLLFTAKREYLGCLASRRSFLWCQFVGYSICVIIFDILLNGLNTVSGRFLVATDLLLFLCMLPMRKLHFDSLRLDYCITLAWAVYCMFWRVVRPENDYTELLFFWVAGSSGLHASAQLMYLLLVLPPALITGQFPIAFTEFVAGTVLMVISLRTDLVCAYLYKQLQEKSHSLETLLDHATDGFCEIDAAQTRVTDASSKLERTLVDDKVDLQNMNFIDFLSSDGDKEELRCLFEDTVNSREVRPILVTCQTLRHTEFDAKLIPYCSSKGTLKLCLVKLGELRDLALPRSQDIKEFGDDSHKQGDEGDEDVVVQVRDFEEQSCKAEDLGTSAYAHDSAMSIISGWSSLNGGVRSTLAYSQTLTEFSSYDCAESGPVVSDKNSQTVWTQTPPALDESSRTVCSQECQTDQSLMVSAATAAAAKRPPPLPGRTSYYVNSKTNKQLFKRFKATRPEIIDMLIEEFLTRVNPRGEGCCSFHVGLIVLSRHMCSMAEQSKCKREPLPEDAWQCHDCTVINTDEMDERICSFCLSSPDGGDSTAVQSDVADDSSSCAADNEDGDAISEDENLSA